MSEVQRWVHNLEMTRYVQMGELILATMGYPEDATPEEILEWMEKKANKSWVDRAIEENVHVGQETQDPDDPFWAIINGSK